MRGRSTNCSQPESRRRTWLSGVVIIGLSACASAQSRPQPLPATANQPNDNQNVGTQRALDAIAAELRSLREQATRAEQREAARDAEPGPPIASNWVLILVTGGAVWAAFRTLGQIKKQVVANATAADAAKTSADAAKVAADAELLAQRAYVSMSHNPPGFIIAAASVNNARSLRVVIAVTNKGNTPARVTDAQVFVHYSSNPLPADPPYATLTGPPSTAYLVKNEQFNIDSPFSYPEHIWAQIQAGGLTLWVLGYVDYVDAFNQRHRAGYARRYAPGAPAQNNLPFETQHGYNYDRPMP